MKLQEHNYSNAHLTKNSQKLRKEMTKEEYDEAYKIAYDLTERLKNNKEKLQHFIDGYLKKFLNSKGGQKNELQITNIR